MLSNVSSEFVKIDPSKLPPLNKDSDGLIPPQDWLQLDVVYKCLVEIYDKKKTYIGVNGEVVVYKPRKTSLETFVGMLVLYGIYRVITMTGKGALSSHMAWGSKPMRNKIMAFLKTINGIRSFVDGPGTDGDIVGYVHCHKIGQSIWNFNNKYKNYGFWYEGTIVDNSCVKGIYYGFKEVMDLIGHQWPKAKEGVLITVDTDMTTLDVNVGSI